MRVFSILPASVLALAFLVPRPAGAIDRDLRSVLVGGGYGLLGGTALGLASYPLTRDARSIWIGSSVGLYLGIVIGVYNAIARDDPGNPLRGEADRPGEPGSGAPPSAERELGLGPSSRPDLADALPSALRAEKELGPPAWFELKI